METLRPVSLKDVPARAKGGPGRHSPYEEIFRAALGLRNKALPVKCETVEEAVRLAHTCHYSRGRGNILGLCATQRDKTVFIYRRGDSKIVGAALGDGA